MIILLWRDREYEDYQGGIVYQGDEWKNDIDILLEEGKILISCPRVNTMKARQSMRRIFCLSWLIDIHIHGCAGRDVMDGSVDALEDIARFIAGHGTTSFLATTAASSGSNPSSLKAVAAIMKSSAGSPDSGGSSRGPL